MVSCHILCVAEVHPQIPPRDDVAPQSTQSEIHGVGRRGHVVTGGANEQAKCKAVGKAIPIVDGAYADQRVSVGLIQLDAHSQIIVGGNRAARPQPEVRSKSDLAGDDR